MNQRGEGIRPPKLAKVDIIDAANRLTGKYREALGDDMALLGMNFNLHYDLVIYPDYEVRLEERCTLGYDANGTKILGEFDPASNTAYIDSELAPELDDPRRTFTLFHEVAGHGVLQGDWIRTEFDRLKKTGRVTTTQAMLDPRTTNILEWQANVFAGHVAAPNWLLNHWMQTRLRLGGPVQFIGRGEYCVEVAGHTFVYFADSFDDMCRRLAHGVKPFFGGLSAEALSYRVAESGWAIDLSDMPLRLQRKAKSALTTSRV